MRTTRWFVLAIVVLGGLAALAGDEEKERLSYRQWLARLDTWIAAREDRPRIDEEARKEIVAIRDGLRGLTAKDLYDGLSEKDRRELRDMLRTDERLDGYASRIARVADEVGLGADDAEALLELYTEYQENRRKAWQDRETAREEIEKLENAWSRDLAKLLGRARARDVENALRRGGRGRRGR
jgi:hypothetical protein